MITKQWYGTLRIYGDDFSNEHECFEVFLLFIVFVHRALNGADINSNPLYWCG